MNGLAVLFPRELWRVSVPFSARSKINKQHLAAKKAVWANYTLDRLCRLFFEIFRPKGAFIGEMLTANDG